MILADELAAIREDAEEFLPSVAVILLLTRQGDGAGGFDDSYVPQEARPCRLSPVGGGETGTQGGRVSERTTHLVTLSHDAVVSERDRVQVDGAVFEITLVRKRPGLEAVRRLEVREVT